MAALTHGSQVREHPWNLFVHYGVCPLCDPGGGTHGWQRAPTDRTYRNIRGTYLFTTGSVHYGVCPRLLWTRGLSPSAVDGT
ncbi:hypothetical protein Mal15_27390 [Stieleria maiorica]|uniref:Uncharacterized protein n=1 Tax=Stieleria maiorica TaxID=2795974 RepID=A0A5B9MGH9_9BACT|nr:hypothetical protein Mal15_27390 [Stieleria maiorica]